MRLLTFVCAIAMIVAFALPAQAAVQNVKVGGDITIRMIYQKTFDLNENDGNTTVPPITAGGATDADADQGHSEGAQPFMSTVGLNVEADLTDNVSAMVRLLSQFDWNRSEESQGDNGDTEVRLDLAYITLKEMLYSPLTLIIGRQDLWFGDGLIVGAYTGNPDPSSSITADEFTELTAFDAIRAILDYDPWTINLLYARIDQGDEADDAIDDDNRRDLWGVNVGYVFGEYDAEMEAYWFGYHWGALTFDAGNEVNTATNLESNTVHTLGIRGSVMPIENLDLRGEFAVQLGDYSRGLVMDERNREAFAVDVRGEYCWADYAWLPTLGLEYVLFTGEDDTPVGDWEQWHPMFRGKFFSAIREWQEVFYKTDEVSDDSTAAHSGLPGNTNQHQIIVDGSLQPTDNLLLELRYLHFVAEQEDRHGEDDIGDEVDITWTYEYTEDVTFSLLTAWFFPGDVYRDGVSTTTGNDTATEVVGTVSLVF